MPIFRLQQDFELGVAERVPEMETVGWITISRDRHEGFEGVFECIAACAEGDRVDRTGKQ